MKVNADYILRKVGARYVVVATGKSSQNFHGMIRLNDSAAYVFKLLKNDMSEEELVASLMSEYSAEESEARKDIADFIDALKGAGALE